MGNARHWSNRSPYMRQVLPFRNVHLTKTLQQMPHRRHSPRRF
jgi:hypothetical protein